MNREASEVREISPGYGLETAKPVVPVGYKQTEVGVIPEDWDSVEVSQLLSEISMGPFGSDIKVSNFVSEGVPVLDGLNVRQERLLDEFSKFVTESKARSLKKAVARRGDVVITHRGTIGQVSYIPPDSAFDEYVISQSQFRARFNSDVLPQWVTVYFLSERGSKKLLEGKGHTGVPAIAQPTTTFRKLRLPVPPVAEQRAIAKALSDVDALLEELDRLIAKRRDVKQATMQQLLTGQTRLPGFEEEWKLLNMAKNSTLKARIGWQGLTTAEYLKSGEYGLVTGTDFSNGRIAWEVCHYVERSRYEQDKNIQLRENDVLVTKDGTIGKAAYIENLPFPATLNSGVFVIRPINDSYEPKYLYYVLMSQVFTEFLNKLSAGSTISHLYQKDFVNFEFLAPPTTEEQSAISTILSDMESDIEALEQRRSKTADLKQAIMQELLTGRVRLLDAANKIVTKEKTQSEPRKTNVYFMRSVFAAEIVDQLHQEPTFGHVKLEKVLYLAEHLCDVDTGSTYRRKAAGPYDNRALRSIDSQLRKQKWFGVRKEGRRYYYEPLQKQGGHKEYFDRYFPSIKGAFQGIIEAFRFMNTERCEIVATLYSAWNDLLDEHYEVSDEAIVNEILNNWHDSKKRIPEERWFKALYWMRKKGFVPKREA